MELTKDGLRIELLDKENSHFFDLGSANLKPETQALLKLIAQELGRLPNHISVEGHTDSRPYGTNNYTNWELSADRANAARRLMDEHGIKPGQITSVQGCAATAQPGRPPGLPEPAGEHPRPISGHHQPGPSGYGQAPG